MELIEAAEYLVRIGAILGLVLGILSSLYWGYIVLLGFGPTYLAVNIYEILMLIISILALVFCYVILSQFPQRLQADPMRSALYLVGLGIIIAIGAWGIAGLLLVIGAILILIDETS